MNKESHQIGHWSPQELSVLTDIAAAHDRLDQALHKIAAFDPHLRRFWSDSRVLIDLAKKILAEEGKK